MVDDELGVGVAVGVGPAEPENLGEFIEFTSVVTVCKGDAPGNRELISPTGVVEPLHIPGVLGEGIGNLESADGVLGPPDEFKLQLGLDVVPLLEPLLLELLFPELELQLVPDCGEGPPNRCEELLLLS